MRAQPYAVQFIVDIGHSVISVACTPNFSLIVAGAVDRQLYGLGPDGAKKWERRLDHEVWSTAVSADGNRIAAGTANKKPASGTVFVFDSKGEILFKDQIGSPVWGVALSADGSILAASGWNGKLYLYSEDDGNWRRVGEKEIGTAGAYGVTVSDDAAVVAAVAYSRALYFFNPKLEQVAEVPSDEFGYRTRITANSYTAITGMRNGAVRLDERKGHKRSRTKKLSQRPICGVGITPTAKLCAAGGFDGHVHVLTGALDVLWSYRTEGEVWAVDMSYDGRFLCAASGDGKIYAIENYVTDAALEEIILLEANIGRDLKFQEKSDLLTLLTDHYLRYGLIRYGLARIGYWQESRRIDEGLAIPCSVELLEKAIEIEPRNSQAQYELAQYYERANDNWRAGLTYSTAANDLNLRQRAFLAAARCFAKSGHHAAAGSCFRRAREQNLHEDDLRILYNLARSLEDVANFEEAKLYYDILLAWDPRYRDVARRSLAIDRGDHENTRSGRGEADYTGLTVNLLTPDTPRYNDVDTSLHEVVRARAKELHVSEEERKQFKGVLKKYYGNQNGIREKTRNELGYNVESYIKYDFLLPEDEIKKELERVNTLALLEGKAIRRSLDVGAATGRWPRTFASQGIEAYGVDIEAKAIEYAQQKLTKEERERGFPILTVGNGLKLDFGYDNFCLVTCMMGTFSHLLKRDHETFFHEMRRVIRPNGYLLISTWDIECRHQTYLSMYTLTEKQMIDDNSLTQSQLVRTGTHAGFELASVVPICLVPDVFSFELGIKELHAEALNQMLSIDLAARSNFPEMHGQMFLTLFRKPDATMAG